LAVLGATIRREQKIIPWELEHSRILPGRKLQLFPPGKKCEVPFVLLL